MKYCFNCRVKPKTYFNQIDCDHKKFHVIRCPKCGMSVCSYKSIKDVKEKWVKINFIYLDKTE